MGKPLAAAFLDDRAVSIRPNPFDAHFAVALGEIKQLLKR